MVKNFLKRTLCIALSFAMMTGTVMVGAKTKTESIHSKLPAITASQRVRAKQAKASAEAVQLNATNVYTLSDFDTLSNKWQANQEMMLYQGYSDANEYVKVGTIRVGIDGTVVIPDQSFWLFIDDRIVWRFKNCTITVHNCHCLFWDLSLFCLIVCCVIKIKLTICFYVIS